MKRAIVDYHADAAIKRMTWIAAQPRHEPPSTSAGAALTDVPVFVVGMPRCGSSLVEQILASHPDVYGAGELHAIPWTPAIPLTLSYSWAGMPSPTTCKNSASTIAPTTA